MFIVLNFFIYLADFILCQIQCYVIFMTRLSPPVDPVIQNNKPIFDREIHLFMFRGVSPKTSFVLWRFQIHDSKFSLALLISGYSQGSQHYDHIIRVQFLMLNIFTARSLQRVDQQNC